MKSITVFLNPRYFWIYGFLIVLGNTPIINLYFNPLGIRMKCHLSNFKEALVFAEECDLDTSYLRANAETIVADFLRLNAEEVEKLDAHPDNGPGAAAFYFGIGITLNDTPETLSVALAAYAEQFRIAYPVKRKEVVQERPGDDFL